MKLGIFIGCSNYEDADIGTLQYADTDATSMARTFMTICGVLDANSRVLTSDGGRRDQPTKSNIIKQLSSLAAASGGADISTIIFFFSGHGFHSEVDGKDYLVPQDAVFSELEETCVQIELAIKILKKLNPLNIIMYLDACRAATQGGKDIVIETLSSINITSLSFSGVAVFSSCSPGEKSYEVDDLKGGIFTNALGVALSEVGRCKTLYELDSYLTRRIPELCQTYEKPTQYPYARIEPISILEVVLVSDEKLAEWKSNTPIGKEIRSRVEANTDNRITRSDQVLVAIDFGTTHSVISVLDDQGNPIFIPSPRGRALVPSAVTFFDNLDYVVGSDAISGAKAGSGHMISAVKRDIGTDKLYVVGGRALSPEFVASLIIRSLVKNVEEYLGIKPKSILASVPASFSIVQTNALARAFEFADLDLRRLIGEPCAAAVLLHKDGFVNSATIRDVAYLLVIDLGGGTLDVSVLSIGYSVYHVEAVSGDNSLGGLDYD